MKPGDKVYCSLLDDGRPCGYNIGTAVIMAVVYTPVRHDKQYVLEGVDMCHRRRGGHVVGTWKINAVEAEGDFRTYFPSRREAAEDAVRSFFADQAYLMHQAGPVDFGRVLDIGKIVPELEDLLELWREASRADKAAKGGAE